LSAAGVDEKMLADILIAVAGMLIGSLVSSFANGRKVGERLARLETQVGIIIARSPRRITDV
jgi:hypothetical protein